MNTQKRCFTDILVFEMIQIMLPLTAKVIDTLLLRCCGMETQLCASGAASVAAAAVTVLFLRLRLDEEERKELWQGKQTMQPLDFAVLAGVILTIQMGCGLLFPLLETAFRHFGRSAMLQTPDEAAPLLLLHTCLLGPVVEEFIFRGSVIRLRSNGAALAIGLPALLFGLAHGALYQAIYAGLCGLVLGWIALRYSLKCAIIVHIFNNMVLGTILPDVLGTQADGWMPAMFTIVVMVAALSSAGWLAAHKGAIATALETGLSRERWGKALRSPVVLTLLIWNCTVILSSIGKVPKK